VAGRSTLEEHLREIIVPALDESLCIFEKKRCNSFFTYAYLSEHRETVFTSSARKSEELIRRSLPNIAINFVRCKIIENLIRI